MKIETYKGIDVNHDAKKDEFYTNVIIRKGSMGRKDEFITAGRLQKIRDDIDKFLNTSSKKPVLKKVWISESDGTDKYQCVEVVLHNIISNTVLLKYKDGRTKSFNLGDYSYRNISIYIACKENDEIIKNLNKKNEDIAKINKEISCSSGKLIRLVGSHFE